MVISQGDCKVGIVSKIIYAFSKNVGSEHLLIDS